jgi:hypothetical protein
MPTSALQQDDRQRLERPRGKQQEIGGLLRQFLFRTPSGLGAGRRIDKQQLLHPHRRQDSKIIIGSFPDQGKPDAQKLGAEAFLLIGKRDIFSPGFPQQQQAADEQQQNGCCQE